MAINRPDVHKMFGQLQDDLEALRVALAKSNLMLSQYRDEKDTPTSDEAYSLISENRELLLQYEQPFIFSKACITCGGTGHYVHVYRGNQDLPCSFCGGTGQRRER